MADEALTQGSEDVDIRSSKIVHSVRGEEYPQGLFMELAKSRYQRHGSMVILFRRDDIVNLNRHPSVLGHGGSGGTQGAEGTLVPPNELDGPSHEMWRALLDPMFKPDRVARWTGEMRRLADRLIDGFIDAGEADLTQQYSMPLPSEIFLTMLGAPLEDLQFFLAFHDRVLRPKSDDEQEILRQVHAAGAEMTVYIRDMLDTRRTAPPRGDLIDEFLTAELGGNPLTESEQIAVVYSLIMAGLDTIAATLTLIFAWLARHPRETRQVAQDQDLIPGLIEELLRYLGPVPISQRYPLADIDLGDGLVLHKGDKVQIFQGAANVDETAFDDPLTVMVEHPRRRHLSFSSGPHRCLGSHLARLEMRVALERFLTRIPSFAIKPGYTSTFDNLTIRRADYLPVIFPAPDPA